MKWTIQNKKIDEIKPYERNPRILMKKGLSDLKQSMDKFGLAEPIVINTDNVIIGGHGRYEVAKQQGLKEIDVYVPERKLTESEYKELNIRLNKNIAGEFDLDILSSDFDMEELKDWGFNTNDFNLNIDKFDNDNDDKELICPECGYNFKDKE